MAKDVKFEISIPSDTDGFILLKCPSCPEEFMLLVKDIEDESNISTWCPGCGFPHESYITDDVEELSERIIENYIADTLNDFTKELEKIFKNNKSNKSNKNIKSKSINKIKKQYEFPIGRKTGAFTETKYRCCNEVAKILNIRKFIGGYCPFCGGLIDGD